MRFWKFVLSKIPGRKPTIDQLDHITIGKNIRSGSLYVLKESEAGVKEVIEHTGGPPGTGDTHLRAHQIDSILDHPPVPIEKRGKWAHTNETTGAVELVDLPESLQDVFAADDPFFADVVENLYKTKAGVSEKITTIQKPKGLIFGGQVTWITGLQFVASTALYYIMGTPTTAYDTMFTLNPAHATLDRIDIVAVNNDGEYEIIPGTPSATPVEPYVDPLTQIKISTILLPAGTNSFGSIFLQNVIYNENIEWLGSSQDASVNFESTTSPYLGSFCASMENVDTNGYVTFVSPAPVAFADYDIFSLAMKLKASLDINNTFIVQFMLAGVPACAPMPLRVNQFLPNYWQISTFSMRELRSITGITQFDEVRIILRMTNTMGAYTGLYLDYIKLEKSIAASPVSTAVQLVGDVSGTGNVGDIPINTILAEITTAGTFGSATKVPQVTIDAKGRVTSIEEKDIEIQEPELPPHHTYIAWRDAPGSGFTLTPNLSSTYEAILVTHEEITSPVEADFEDLWRPRITQQIIHEVLPGGTTGQVYAKKSNADYDAEWRDEAGGCASSVDLILSQIPEFDKEAHGIKSTFVANENQAFGDVCFINVSGKAQLGKADVIATATVVAMCADLTVLADAVGNYLLIGFVENDDWTLTVGGYVYLSMSGSTGNTLTQTSPFEADPIVEDTVVQLIGIAKSATSIYFNPQLVQVELKP